MIGYHFTSDTLKDGSPIPPIGKWLVHNGIIIPCLSGLHASEHPFDALQYAPGNLLHKVELIIDIQSHGDPADKFVGRKRKILSTVNAESLFYEFSRWCALQVIHLWEAPQIVIDYLNTGDESIKDEARDEAWDKTWAAARAAAEAATLSVSWNVARASARAAVKAEAEAAASHTTWDKTWDGAWSERWSLARKKQRDKFLEMVEASMSV